MCVRRLRPKLWLRWVYKGSLLKAAVPTLSQVQCYKKTWIRRGGGKKMQKVSELHEWGHSHVLLAQLQEHLPGAAGQEQFHNILQLEREFTLPASDARSGWGSKIVTLPGGVLEEGIVLSSFHLLQTNLRSSLHLSERSGRDSLGRLVCGVFGEVDGIHKLHHGRWVLIPVGTHSLRYDTIKKEIVTTFRPWCFLFAKSESIAMVAGAFKALQETSLMLWGHEFTLNTCCIDHSDSLKTGVESTNPFASVVTCWPHFSRKY